MKGDNNVIPYTPLLPTTRAIPYFLEYPVHSKNTDQKLGCAAYSCKDIDDITVFHYLPTVLGYPCESKCVTSAYEFSVPKQSQ
jgi:hypothetical protein